MVSCLGGSRDTERGTLSAPPALPRHSALLAGEASSPASQDQDRLAPDEVPEHGPLVPPKHEALPLITRSLVENTLPDEGWTRCGRGSTGARPVA